MRIRLESNKAILEILSEDINRHPELRFHQLLQNLNIEHNDGKDYFYEESDETLSKIKRV